MYGEKEGIFWNVKGDTGTMIISKDAFVYAAPAEMVIEH
jgi:hypothetical protein